jgi:hypothetical protein
LDVRPANPIQSAGAVPTSQDSAGALQKYYFLLAMNGISSCE